MKNELTPQETIARGMQQHKRDTDALEGLKVLSSICIVLTLGGWAAGGLFGWLLAIPSAMLAVFFLVVYFQLYFK
jgi:hypothetical protein